MNVWTRSGLLPAFASLALSHPQWSTCLAEPAADLAPYRDPQGRFQLQHPGDWAVRALPNGQGITLSRGQAAANVMLAQWAGAAQGLLDSVVNQVRATSPNYRELRRGERQVAGQAGVEVEFTGANPQGAQSRSQITAFVAGGTGYVLFLTAPEGEFAAAQPAWEAVRASLALGGAAPPAAGGDEIGDPAWGFTFRAPAGWKVQKGGQGAVLGHDTIPGMVIVMPHLLPNLQAVQAQMQQGLAEEGVQLSLAGALQPLGSNAVAGDYAGLAGGQQVKARGIGVASPNGGGAYVIAVTAPAQYGPQLAGAADALARGMQFPRVDATDLMRQFAGTWVTTTTNTMTTVVLSPNGEYSYAYESVYSGTVKDQGGDLNAWQRGAQNQAKGRWSVQGDPRQGVLTMASDQGTQTVRYQVHVEKGETYWREYRFDGVLYQKK